MDKLFLLVLGVIYGWPSDGILWNVELGGNERTEGAARLGLRLGSQKEEGYMAIGSGIGVDVLRDTSGRTVYDVSSLLPVGVYGTAALLYLWPSSDESNISSQREGGMGTGLIFMALLPFLSAPLWITDLELEEGWGPWGLYQRHQLDYFMPDAHWREKLSGGCFVRPFIGVDPGENPAMWLGVRLGYFRSYSKSSFLRGSGLESSLRLE